MVARLAINILFLTEQVSGLIRGMLKCGNVFHKSLKNNAAQPFSGKF